jgi:hypothetical protein
LRSCSNFPSDREATYTLALCFSSCFTASFPIPVAPLRGQILCQSVSSLLWCQWFNVLTRWLSQPCQSDSECLQQRISFETTPWLLSNVTTKCRETKHSDC